jgi:hypothetical protein
MKNSVFVKISQKKLSDLPRLNNQILIFLERLSLKRQIEKSKITVFINLFGDDILFETITISFRWMDKAKPKH